MFNFFKDKKFYITTSIPYANAGPHIGHILDPLIADVLARYHRKNGDDVRFLTGSDEHGAKIVRTAEAQNKTPRQLVDENAVKFRSLKDLLNLSWDDFIRTSDEKRHWPGAQKMWNQLVASGDIYKKKYRGFYCVGHEAFITEKDLVDGICPDHQKAPEVIEEENWFFKLSKYSRTIESKIKSGELKVLPESRRNEILALIKDGLEDVSFSRPSEDLSWGVPVPGDPTQTMYVWCDALVNYISAVGYGHEDTESRALFKKWWPADAQIIGKDNLRFHAAIWPGMLLSAGLGLPKTIFVHGFVNVDGKKISKSVGNVILPEDIVKKYGVDPVRYYFLREFRSAEDGDFSYEKFEERYNGDLANGLGNFAARVLTLASKEGKLTGTPKKDTENFVALVKKNILDFRFDMALNEIWNLIHYGDGYLNLTKPWSKDLPEAKRKEVLYDLVFTLKTLSDLLIPFLPETSGKIAASIDAKDGGFIAQKIDNLFPRIQEK